jgi:hypothetical protein
VVKHARRGNHSAAVEALRVDGTGALVQDLIDDRHARSSLPSSLSLINTWTSFHTEVFGSGAECGLPVLPVTHRSFCAVAALFKRGGYRSFANYASAIKSADIEAGHQWTQALDQLVTWCTRSVLRGIGPARQSQAFLFSKMLLGDRPVEPLVDGGCIGPWSMAMLATMFLLREIEASNAEMRNWTFDVPAMELHWHLPSSKSDTMALGTSRTWGCLCAIPSLACPYHIALSHRDVMVARFGPLSTIMDMPIFPGLGGLVVSKSAVVATFEALATSVGQATLSIDGARLLGGHSARVTGAQILAAHGVEVAKIRILARHSGDAILRYVSESPLKAIRHDLGLAPVGTSSCSSATFAGGNLTSRAAANLRARMSIIETAIDRSVALAEQALAEVTAHTMTAHPVITTLFVQNVVTGAVHGARTHHTGSTGCGWRFASARKKGLGLPYLFLDSLDGLAWWSICERCLTLEREAARVVATEPEQPLSD